MAKYLKDFSIQVDPLQELPEGRTRKDFNLSTNLITNLFRYKIPGKYNMLGMSKLNIIIQQRDTDRKFIVHYDGIGIYKYTRFNFDEYFKLHTIGKNLTILNVLKYTLHDILGKDKIALAQMLQIAN